MLTFVGRLFGSDCPCLLYVLAYYKIFFFSPSVLDRLNGLLEPGGVLSINERGVIDGEVPVVKPHPDFR